MKCHSCGVDKLSKEFPHEHLTKECTKHPLLHCLRCATKSVKDDKKCSQCVAVVDEDNRQYKKYVQTLRFLFPAIITGDKPTISGGELATASQSGGATANDTTPNIFVTTLSGESITIVYNPEQTIMYLKSIVNEKFGIPSNKQCLLHNNEVLETSNSEGKQLRLKDCGVNPNGRIYLVILLYAIPWNMDIIFDLSWGYPKKTLNFEIFELKWFKVRDYLDASVFLYSDSKFIEVVDYRNKASKSCPAVEHSGDVMHDKDKLGHHTISVSTQSIPAEVNRLVFTLSAWNAPNVSKYTNPSLKCYDKKKQNEQLCDDVLGCAANLKAIIMCCLTKRSDEWQVVSLKYPSAGNAKNYDQLKTTIEHLIESGQMP
ncbi:uncharacterized protein LOC114520098 [Dendronephthya gigantea]|uniref:uncharacterized protein LOC114520098 n=1 Tax=Dendronephthya gigantea TaxID=151771 RepID=UPI00106C6AEF|nr:uncharacterized protein LOC114520098 [Dendronephthya gigantea]